jgi:hypothetical protein
MTRGALRSDAFETIAGDLSLFVATGVHGICTPRVSRQNQVYRGASRREQ